MFANSLSDRYQLLINVIMFHCRSKPAASLMWKVNDQEVNTNYESYPNFGGGFIESLRHKSGKGNGENSGNRKAYPLVSPWVQPLNLKGMIVAGKSNPVTCRGITSGGSF